MPMTIDSKQPDISLDQFSQLVEILYQGPLETIPWQAFLNAIKRQLDVEGAILILRHPSESDLGAIVTEGFSELESRRETIYSEGLYAMDPFLNLPQGKVVTLEEHIGNDALINSEFYKLALQPFDIFHLLGIDIHEQNGLKASLRLSRPPTSKKFSPQDKQLCSLLIPHLQQAIHIHAQINHIESERALYASTVGQMSVATVLLDKNRQVLTTNILAKQLLAEKDGIRIREGTLQLDHPQDNKHLRNIVSDALSTQQQAKLVEALPVERPSGRQPLGLIIRPVPANEWTKGQSTPTVAIFISDPEIKTEASQQVLAQLFSFTPAEARLAMLLSNGLSLDEAVAELKVSRNTGRAHLRSIFSKTGITQQTQLVSLILKSVASLG